MEQAITCCFTGHRPEKLPWHNNELDARCITLKNDIQNAVEQAYAQGYRHFISGMAQGCDLYFCEAVIALRNQYPDVTLEAAIPCAEQADRWSKLQQMRYHRLLEQCDIKTMVQQHYDRSCMLRRNRYMVDHSSLLIAAFDGSNGGTMYTVSYALKSGVKIHGITLNGFCYHD